MKVSHKIKTRSIIIILIAFRPLPRLVSSQNSVCETEDSSLFVLYLACHELRKNVIKNKYRGLLMLTDTAALNKLSS